MADKRQLLQSNGLLELTCSAAKRSINPWRVVMGERLFNTRHLCLPKYRSLIIVKKKRLLLLREGIYDAQTR